MFYNYITINGAKIWKFILYCLYMYRRLQSFSSFASNDLLLNNGVGKTYWNTIVSFPGRTWTAMSNLIQDSLFLDQDFDLGLPQVMNKISNLLCLGLLTWYSRFSTEPRMFFKWLPGHTSGWGAAPMVLRGRDRFENILLMNDCFHRVTKYVKRFSIFAYSRMFVGWVQTSARPLMYQWYVWRFSRNCVPRSVQHKHTAVTVHPSGPKPTGVDELPQETSRQDILLSTCLLVTEFVHVPHKTHMHYHTAHCKSVGLNLFSEFLTVPKWVMHIIYRSQCT